MDTTEEEFLKIIENHLTVDSNGNIIIVDEILAKKYKEYLEKFASRTEEPLRANLKCVNVLCPQL